MKNLFYKKKFLLKELKQPKIKNDPGLVNAEMSVLEGMLKRMEKEENYEMAAVIFSRLEDIKGNGT
jgi:hypothetical protein